MSIEEKNQINSVNVILQELNSDQNQQNTYAFVSYSESNKDDAFEVMEILLRNGIDIRSCEKMDMENVYNTVEDSRCKCVITLTSKKYILDCKCLLHQYARFRKNQKLNDGKRGQVPCLVIDLANDRCKYKDDIGGEEINVEDTNKEKIDVEEIRRGLENFYQLKDGNVKKLIDRQTNAIQENDYDETRRQMSFILDYDGHLDNVANFKDIKNFAGNIAKKLKNQGVSVSDNIKEKCVNHFDEWGKSVYCLKLNKESDEKHMATIVCSEDNELYIKKGSYIVENPKKDRYNNEMIRKIYHKYILNGVMKSSSDINMLVTVENIKEKMTIEEVTLFITGEEQENVGELWKKVNIDNTYAKDLAERGNA